MQNYLVFSDKFKIFKKFFDNSIAFKDFNKYPDLLLMTSSLQPGTFEVITGLPDAIDSNKNLINPHDN